MEREKIIIENKEVDKRYIGNKLVWESIKFLGEVQRCYVNFSANRMNIFANSYDFTDTDRVKKIEFDGVEVVGYSTFEKQSYQYLITFPNAVALEKFKEAAGLRGRSDKSNVTLKFYGR